MKKILLLMFCIVLLIGTVSAADFDDVKYYDGETTTYTLENFFGLGKHIADLELKTPHNYEVGLGYQKAAEIEIRNGEYDYEEIINGIELYNIEEDMKEVVRNVDYKYKTIVQVPNYETVCNDIIHPNETISNVCIQVEKGTKEKVVWEDFDKNSLLKGEVITLGLFTNVQKGDHVEWIINVYGNEKLTKWAEWTESLNVGLVVYYNFDDGSGAVLDDVVRHEKNGTILGTPVWLGGILGGALNFDNATDSVNISHTLWNADEQTVSFWIAPNTTIADLVGDYETLYRTHPHSYTFVTQTGAGSSTKVQSFAGGTEITRIDEGEVNKWWENSTWIHVFTNMSASGGGWIIINGGAYNYTEQTGSYTKNNPSYTFLGRHPDNNDYNYYGAMDEFGLWNRSLSYAEAVQLYNGGVGITYIAKFGSNSPIITLNSPVNTFNSTSSSITFNGTVSDDVNLVNVSLYIDGVLNETNSSGINNTDYIFTKALSEGNHNWTYKAYDNESQATTATTRNLTIDTISPVVNIVYPLNTTYSDNYTTNETRTMDLNWTATDTNLGSCWYSTNMGITNTTITCGQNQTFTLDYGFYNFTAYANDTFGRESSDQVFTTWDYKILENYYLYDNDSYETLKEEFSINISSDGSEIILGSLIYNGTPYLATKTGNNHVMEFNRTITLNQVGNVSFYWSFNYGGEIINSSTFNQTVNEIRMGLCGGDLNIIRTLNFSTHNETDLTELIPFTFYGTFHYWIGDGSITKNFSISNASVNSVNICIDPNRTFYTNAIIQYEKTGFVKRSYYLINETLTYTNATKELYFLNTTISTSFIIEVKDEVQLPIEDVYIYIQRYYPGTNQYKTVEMALTDDIGSTIGHFEAETEDYRLIFEKGQVIIYQSGTQKIFCRETPCTLTFQTVAGAGISWGDIGVIDLFTWTLDYDEATEVWTLIYTDTSGSIGYGRLYVYYEDPEEGKVTICNTSSTQLADTITCDVTGYNGTIYAAAYLSRSPEILVYLKSIVISALKAIFGLEGLFLSMFILLALAMAGLWNPAVGIILVVVGMIVLNVMGLAAFGATAIWSIIFIALIILWEIKT